jgi:hypothetical protein
LILYRCWMVSVIVSASPRCCRPMPRDVMGRTQRPSSLPRSGTLGLMMRVGAIPELARRSPPRRFGVSMTAAWTFCRRFLKACPGRCCWRCCRSC